MLTDEIVAEINKNHKKVSLWVVAMVVALLLLPAIVKIGSGAGALWLFISAALVGFAQKQDLKRKTTTVIYDEGPVKDGFFLTTSSFERAVRSKRVWRVISAKDIVDRKHNAGASRNVRRLDTKMGIGHPKYVHTNIRVPYIKGKKKIFFFPDAMLLIGTTGCTKIPYDQVSIWASSTRFIEGGFFYPREAPVIDHTWSVVNKKGGPDKRVKNNRKLPVVRYDVLTVRSGDIIHDEFHLSAPGSAEEFERSFAALKQASIAPPSQPLKRKDEAIDLLNQ